MNNHDEQFLPEQVDEQIERIEQSTQQEPASRLIHDLRIVSQDSTEVFDRVWDRLLDHMEHGQIPSTEAQQRLNERIDIMSPIQPIQPARQPKPRRRFASWLTLVAAIIITLLVAGSAAAVFHYASAQQPHKTIVGAPTKSHPTSTPGITPTATATPLPANLCLGDSGWKTVCTENQYTIIDQRGNLNGTSIHIYAGYADSNRIILAYTMQLNKSNSKSNPNQIMQPTLTPTLTLSAQKGVNISPRSTGGGFTDPKTMQSYELASVPLLSVANTITVLNLHVDVAFFSAQKASFDFSLPFHRGHIVTINQTQMVNGQPITLDHVSISSTQTVIYVRGTQLNTGMLSIADPLTSPYELHIGNWSSRDNAADFTYESWNNNDDKHQPVEGIELLVNYPLLNHTGEWTLLIHQEAIPGATSDVVFHFKN